MDIKFTFSSCLAYLPTHIVFSHIFTSQPTTRPSDAPSKAPTPYPSPPPTTRQVTSLDYTVTSLNFSFSLTLISFCLFVLYSVPAHQPIALPRSRRAPQNRSSIFVLPSICQDLSATMGLGLNALIAVHHSFLSFSLLSVRTHL